MSTLTKPFTFTGGTYAVAAQVNSDLDTIYGWINGGSAIWADASVAFTGIPTGPSSDPSSANQFTRKSYVDAITAFSGTQRLRLSCGVQNITTNSSGEAAVTFNPTFPTTCSGVVITNNNDDAISGLGFDLKVQNTSGMFVHVFVSSSGANYVGGPISIGWIAFGF